MFSPLFSKPKHTYLPAEWGGMMHNKLKTLLMPEVKMDMTVILSWTLPVVCSLFMAFYLHRSHVYTAAWCLRMKLYIFAFNLKMCKKTSSWYTKTSLNNKVNVRQLYHPWLRYLLLATYQLKSFHNLERKHCIHGCQRWCKHQNSLTKFKMWINRLVNWQKTNSFDKWFII